MYKEPLHLSSSSRSNSFGQNSTTSNTFGPSIPQCNAKRKKAKKSQSNSSDSAAAVGGVQAKSSVVQRTPDTVIHPAPANVSLPSQEPDEEPTRPNPKVLDKHEGTGARFAKTNSPLFPTDANGKQTLPSLDDVKQAKIGDCYLEAAIASIAKTDPQYIYSMFRDHGDTVSVRLYDVDESNFLKPKFTPRYIKIEKSIVVSDTNEPLYNRGELWVHMLQKAYAAGGFGGNAVETKINQDKPASYERMRSGTSVYAFSVLLGKPSNFSLLNQQEEPGDFRDRGGTRMSNIKELPWSYTELDTYSQNTPQRPRDYNKLVSYKIFEDLQKVDDWITWLQADGLNRIFNLYSNKKGSSNYNQEIIRLEDLEGATSS